jgi:sugar lactone lactonase YvrE
LALASAGFGATDPLAHPWGLAVDAKGNLYVANTYGYNILVFTPGYAAKKTLTITKGVSAPSGVAFDPLGNLWVANAGPGNGSNDGSITEYTNGIQNTSATITNGIVRPAAIAIDGLDVIYVVNDFSNVTIYAPTSVFSTPSTLISTTALSNPVYGIAVGAGTLSWGSSGTTIFTSESGYLLHQTADLTGMPGTALALASDPNGNVYAANMDQTVTINNPQNGGNFGGFVTLSFVPYGIAIDNVRGRVYFSDPNGNAIWVYSTAGTLLKTIR